MGTTRTRTTRWGYATKLTGVATDTTLGAATRYEFGAKTIALETHTAARVIKSVFLEITLVGAETSAQDYDAVRIGTNVGAAGFIDVDTTYTAANTGEQETFVAKHDLTANFVTNQGTGTTVTVDVAVAVAQGGVAAVLAITAELFVTYEYDDAATSHIKTVLIPLQSSLATIAATYAEGGAAGTGACPANQIPQLTGAGSPFLPESSITIKDQYIVMLGMTAPASTTDINLVARLDGATDLTRAVYEEALQSNVFVKDIIDSTLMPSTTAAHAFELKSSTATRFLCVGGYMVVTYAYDPASTTHLNSVIVPLDSELGDLNGGNYIASNAGLPGPQRYHARVNIQEPGPIVMKQSGVVTYRSVGPGATNATYMYATHQTQRPYDAVGSMLTTAFMPCVHRCDHSKSLWSLGHGNNDLPFEYYELNSAVYLSVSGYAIVNYHSGLAAQGAGAHNQTRWWFQKAYAGSPVSSIEVQATTPAIPEASYYTSGVMMDYHMRHGAGMAQHIQVERYDHNGGGWYVAELDQGSVAEIGTRIWCVPVSRWWRRFPEDPRRDKSDLEELTPIGAPNGIGEARSWRYASGNGSGAASFASCLAHTYHAITGTVAGTYTINGSPLLSTADVVDVYEVGRDHSEVIARDLDTDGSGNFTATVYDKETEYVAIGKGTTPGGSAVQHASPAVTTPPWIVGIGPSSHGTIAGTVYAPRQDIYDIDLMLMASQHALTLDTSGGFANVADSPVFADDSGTANDLYLYLMWRRVTSSMMVNPVVAAPADHFLAQIITVRGCIRTGNPWDVTAFDVATGGDSASVTIPGDTTTVDNALVLAIVAGSGDVSENTETATAWVNASLADFRNLGERNTGDGDGSGFFFAMGIKLLMGAYDATTATLSNAQRQARLSIALKPHIATAGDFDIVASTAAFRRIGSPVVRSWGV